VMAEGAFICGRERREGGAIIFCCGLARWGRHKLKGFAHAQWEKQSNFLLL
jgi:hypothetical protein